MEQEIISELKALWRKNMFNAYYANQNRDTVVCIILAFFCGFCGWALRKSLFCIYFIGMFVFVMYHLLQNVVKQFAGGLYSYYHSLRVLRWLSDEDLRTLCQEYIRSMAETTVNNNLGNLTSVGIILEGGIALWSDILELRFTPLL